MGKFNSVVPVTVAVAAVMAIGLCLAMMGTATPARAATLCVDGVSYTTIQAAINAANDGDTVRIVARPAPYTENLVIDRSIALLGGYSTNNKPCDVRPHPAPQYTVIDGGAAGSVVSISAGSTATLDGLTLTNGQTDEGGGVHVSGASPTLHNVVVTGNVISPTVTGGVDYADGGGVFVRDGTITLSGCEITYNLAYADSPDTARGGGLALCGVYGAEGNAIIEATNIMSNTGAADSKLHGGGLFMKEYSRVTFRGSDNLIAYNEATAGGGVYMYGNVDLEGVRILENYASDKGGGIFLASSLDGARIANNHLIRNSAAVVAPSIMAPDSSVEIANNTIIGDSSGEGIYVGDLANGTLELTNNIVVNHAIGIKVNSGASVTLANNDVWGNTTNYEGASPGSGDISADPEFVDPDNGDYHLTADSPCVNAGAYVEGLLFDYEGDRRTGTLLDVGADEYGSDYLLFIPAALNRYTP